MRALLDTHVFLWAVSDDGRLSAPARSVLDDPSADLLVSAASAYELAFKIALGRLHVPAEPIEWIVSRAGALRLRWLAVTDDHAGRAGLLPLVHRDPWDRLLVAQAMSEGIPLVTADERIRRYDVDTIW